MRTCSEAVASVRSDDGGGAVGCTVGLSRVVLPCSSFFVCGTVVLRFPGKCRPLECKGYFVSRLSRTV